MIIKTASHLRDRCRQINRGQALFLVAAVLIGTGFALTNLLDFDVWFHLRAGAYTFRHLHPPATEEFSFPSAGQPYISIQWLFQCLVYAFYSLAGEPGLILINALLVALLLFLFAAAAGLKWSDGSFLLLAAVVLGCSANLNLRPLLLTLIYLSACFLIWRRGQDYWLLPLLQLLWTNSHGLFIFGLLVIGAWGLEDIRHRWKYGAVSFLVCLLNPYGFEGLRFPLLLFSRISGSNLYSQSIGELQPAFDAGFYLHYGAGWGCLLLVAGLIAAWCAAFRRREKAVVLFSAALLAVAFGYLYLRAMRNMPVLAVTYGWLIARLAPELRDWRLPSIGWRLAAGLAILGGITAFHLRQAVSGYPGILRGCYAETSWRQAASYSVPVGAVDYLRRHPLPGRLFNDFNWGGYLMFNLPDNRVFIDPRLEVHSPELFADYLRVTREPDYFFELDRRYDFDLALFCHFPCRGIPGLFKLLRESPEWRLLYVDAFAAVFGRQRPGAVSLPPAENRLPPPPPLPLLRDAYLRNGMENYSLFLRSGSLTATYGNIGTGHFYLYCGTPEKALPFLLQAALRTPQVGDTHFFLAGVALAAGDRELAGAALENARQVQPGHPELPELQSVLENSMASP